MEQLEKDRQAEALYNVLVNPADKRLHVYDLQNLVNYYPQSSLLYLLISRSGNQEFIKSSAVYYNSKSVFRLVNDPENRPEVKPEQVIDIDHFQFNEPPPIDPLIAQNYEPTIDDLALAEINKRKFGTETEWTSYDPDETEQEQEEVQEQMYVAQLPGTQPQQIPDQPAEQPEAQSQEPVAETNEATPAEEEGPSEDVVRMREERRRFFQSFNASHDEDEDHLIDPFHLANAPVTPAVTPAAFEPIANEAASWNTLNFEDADPKVEFEIPEIAAKQEATAESSAVDEARPQQEEDQASIQEATQQEEQPSTQEHRQEEEWQSQLETNTDEPVAIEAPTVDTAEVEAFQEITEVPEAAPEQAIQPVAPDYQSDESWHNWDEIFEEIDEVPDPFAPVYQERTAAPVELKEETPQQEPETAQDTEYVFEETTDISRSETQDTEGPADEELAAANDEAAYEQIAEVQQYEPEASDWKYEEAVTSTNDEPVFEEIADSPYIEPVAAPQQEEITSHDDEPVYEEIAEAPKQEQAAESRPVEQEAAAMPTEQVKPDEPEMREMYSEIDEPVYDEIAEAPKHEQAAESHYDEINAVHEHAGQIQPDEPEPREMYSEIDDPVYDEIAEPPVFEIPEKNEPVYEGISPEPAPAYQEAVIEKQQAGSVEPETQPVQSEDRYEETDRKEAEQPREEPGGFDDDIFFIPPSSQYFMPPVMPSVPDMPSFAVEHKPEPVSAEPVKAQSYSEDVTERVQQAAQSAPIAEEVPVPEETREEVVDDQQGYTEAEIIEETPAKEQKAVTKEPIAEFDGLIAENIVTADYFSFDRSRVKDPVEQEPRAAYTDFPEDAQQVAKYHDENMPYTFLWWLDKTRQEYAGTYQPYSQPVPPQKQASQDGNTATPKQHEAVRSKEEEIIERFIKEEPQIKPPSSDKLDNENKARQSAEDTGELVTETLARIYTEQMLYHKAIATYKKLILRFPEKSRYFAGQIELLENKIK